MTDIGALKSDNLARWERMQIRPDDLAMVDKVAHKLIAAQLRYEAVAHAVWGKPEMWPIVAVIDQRESGADPKCSLAQGDPWDRVSVHVPSGEGPFPSWEACAIHALKNDDHLDEWHDWSIGGTLTKIQAYNGLGHAERPSPYIWSMTDQYGPPEAPAGKYTSDGHYDPNAVDKQIGVAAMLARMWALAPEDVNFWGHPLTSAALISPTTPEQVAHAPDPPKPDPGPLPLHDTKWIQEMLNRTWIVRPLVVDGIYGKDTKAAVRAFQRAHDGLNADGIAGVLTQAALECLLDDVTQKAQLE